MADVIARLGRQSHRQIGGPVVRGCVCRIWTGYSKDGRYGCMKIDGEQIGTHRASYEAFVGPVPPDMIVCHHCDTPRCIEPRHLFVGTHLDNARDRDAKGRGRCFEGADRRGARNGRSKLSERDVVAIRRMYSDCSVTQQRIAEVFGVTQGAVTQIVLNKTWQHVAAGAQQ